MEWFSTEEELSAWKNRDKRLTAAFRILIVVTLIAFIVLCLLVQGFDFADVEGDELLCAAGGRAGSAVHAALERGHQLLQLVQLVEVAVVEVDNAGLGDIISKIDHA